MINDNKVGIGNKNRIGYNSGMKTQDKVGNRTIKVVRYLIKNMAIPTKTSIIKMCYLCDLASMNKNGKKITDFNYVRYYYGPYDSRIDALLEDLIKSGEVDFSIEYNSHGEEYVRYRVMTDTELDQSAAAVIDPILQSLGSLNAKMLTEIAYKTKPMKVLGAKLGGKEHLGEKLNLSAV
jgi:uncharacterized phage-associated protein